MMIVWSNRLNLEVVEALRLSAVKQGRDQREIVEEALLAMLPREDIAEGRRIAEMKAERLVEASRGSSREVGKAREIPGAKSHVRRSAAP